MLAASPASYIPGHSSLHQSWKPKVSKGPPPAKLDTTCCQSQASRLRTDQARHHLQAGASDYQSSPPHKPDRHQSPQRFPPTRPRATAEASHLNGEPRPKYWRAVVNHGLRSLLGQGFGVRDVEGGISHHSSGNKGGEHYLQGGLAWRRVASSHTQGPANY